MIAQIGFRLHRYVSSRTLAWSKATYRQSSQSLSSMSNIVVNLYRICLQRPMRGCLLLLRDAADNLVKLFVRDVECGGRVQEISADPCLYLYLAEVLNGILEVKQRESF